MASSHERIAQKSRTREAIMTGARGLMADGLPVTVTAAAARVGVSKATAYRYFGDPHALAAEAGLAVHVKTYEEITKDAGTLREKLVAINLYLFDLVIAHEPMFRQFLARSLEASVREAPIAGRRGARRVSMYEAAMLETGVQLPEDKALLLKTGLSAATGPEALISYFDIAGVPLSVARKVVEETTLAIADRFLGGWESTAT